MKKAILATKVGMTQIFNEDRESWFRLNCSTSWTMCSNTGQNSWEWQFTKQFSPVCWQERRKIVTKRDKSGKKRCTQKLVWQEQKKDPLTKTGEGKQIWKGFQVEMLKIYIGSGNQSDIFAARDKGRCSSNLKVKGSRGSKRHNQRWGPMTHGSKFHRHLGSNGAASDPSTCIQRKRNAWTDGEKRITLQNHEIVKVDALRNNLSVS